MAGDTLMEPFWPTGSGLARGFLGAFDAAWMIRGYVEGLNPLMLLAERESILKLLSQATPDTLLQNFAKYSIDPSTRYNLSQVVSLHTMVANPKFPAIDGDFRDFRRFQEYFPTISLILLADFLKNRR